MKHLKNDKTGKTVAITKTKFKKTRPSQRTEASISNHLRNNPNKSKLSPFDLAKLIEKLVFALKTVGDSEDVKSYLDGAFEDAESCQQVRTNCQDLKSLLQQIGNRGDSSNNDLPATLARYDQFMVLRSDSSSMYLCRPIEVFEFNKTSYNRRKTLGLVRTQGTTFPLMCALSGLEVPVKEHPMILDNGKWLVLVKRVAKFFGHEFKGTQYDSWDTRPQGDVQASHVEPFLMLWYALYLVRRVLGKEMPDEKLLGHLYLLKARGENFEAEILLSKWSCRPCQKFLKRFQDFTGITFSFKDFDNYAPVLPLKNEQNEAYYARYGSYDDEEELELAVQLAMENIYEIKKARSRPVVELPRVQDLFENTSQKGHHQTATNTSTGTTSLQISRIRHFMCDASQRQVKTIMLQANVKVLTNENKCTTQLVDGTSKTVSGRDTKPAEKLQPAPGGETFSLEARTRAKLLKRRQRRRRSESPLLKEKDRWAGYGSTHTRHGRKGRFLTF
ncbi:uncharacterized protein LY89DRAFT_730870 [Mollisia scopiformis]|uniref:Uncharacterized protein n=1 Tax=Mollisia scopiformis TaxID=149040 RepID=A0A194XL48_MOLSC|nr:uncharacterized protein LY89DRAFT_730870 [Mollisia scopiformis]KUJ20856.1 hypothetical protein LY89DRAFT_730870 [Mollisia scopiformis]